MAQFKLELLTPVSRNGIVMYLASTITNFKSQRLGYRDSSWNENDSKGSYNRDVLDTSEPVYSYTSAENFSVGKNAQKTLSFTMQRKILQGEYWEDNPYVDNIHIGSQLVLTDKYGDEHLFTVKDIQFKLSEINIEYTYTCQDTFNYQTIRQNDGYTIKNDAESDDFIGAKTADWWIYSKIKPECYITYEFLPFATGLYRDTQNRNRTFTSTDVLSAVDEIIKPIYTDAVFFETIPFSCSGSNGIAALISLAEQIGCQINVAEKRYYDESGYLFFQKYFWLEPTKNSQPSGLVYSPKNNIKNFGLSFKGDSLTTVMNVLSSELNDEEIGLFPSIPGIFSSYFYSDEWKKSKYYSGMFTDIINGTYLTNTGDTANVDIDTSITDICFNNQLYTTFALQNLGFSTFFLPIYYNQLRLSWSNEKTSYQFSNQSSDILLTNASRPMLLLLSLAPLNSNSTLDGSNVEGVTVKYLRKDVLILQEGEEIPSSWLGKKVYCYIAIPITNSTLVQNVHFYGYLTRDFSEEEYAFAKVADQCPWLENKLIDFSYFLEQNILSRSEYQSLMDFLVNDIRIINGQLMASAQSYYRALHQQVQTIAELQNKIDLLGAECQSAIIDTYATEGAVTKLDQFDLTYRSLFQQVNGSQRTGLLNYNEMISETFTDFFNAEQRFLKNIYNFKQYFNMINSFSTAENACIVQDTLSIDLDRIMSEEYIKDPTNYEVNYISFSPSQYSSIYDKNYKIKPELYHEVSKTTLVPFYEFDQVYRPVSIVNQNNITHFYKPLMKKGNIVPITDNFNISEEELKTFWQYNNDNTYFLSWTKYSEIFNVDINLSQTKKITPAEENILARIQWLALEHDKPTKCIELTPQELVILYLYKHPNEYYIRDRSRYIPLDWIRYAPILNDSDLKDSGYGQKKIELVGHAVFSGCNFRAMLYPNSSFADVEWNTAENPIAERKKLNQQKDKEEYRTYWTIYKHQFPIQEAYYYGSTIQVIKTTTDDGDRYTYELKNEKGQNLATWNAAAVEARGTNPYDYKAFQSVSFYNKTIASGISSSEFKEEYATQYNNFPYYAYSWDNSASILANINVGLALVSRLAMTIPTVSWILTMPSVGIGIATSNASIGSWRNIYHPLRAIVGTDDVLLSDYANWGSNYKATENAGADDVRFYDSAYPLFLKSQDGINTFLEYSEGLKNTYSFLEPFQYVNYYSNIVATYSFDYKTPFEKDETADKETLRAPYSTEGKDIPNTQYKLWTKNTYWRVLPAGATINRSDNYYILPLLMKPINSTSYNKIDITTPTALVQALLDKINGEWSDEMLIGYYNGADKVKVRIPYSNPMECSTGLQSWYRGIEEDISDTSAINSLKWENRRYSQIQYNFWKPFLTKLSFNGEEDFWDNNGYGVLNYNYLPSAEDSKKLSPIAYQLVQDDSATGGWVGQFIMIFVVLHEENYEQGLIDNISGPIYHNYWDNYSSDLSKTFGYKVSLSKAQSQTIYRCGTDKQEDILRKDDLLKPYNDLTIYCLSAKDSVFVPCESTDWEKYKTSPESYPLYYERVGDQYIRRYSIYDLLLPDAYKPPLYFLDGFTSSIYNFVDNETAFKVELFLHHLKVVDDQIEAHDIIQYPGLYDINFSKDSNQYDLKLIYNGLTYESPILLHRGIPEYFKTMSNGEFWYRYRERTELTVLFEHCAIIETELTMYWQQALTASKYCSYFLPDSWTPTVQTAVNYFSSDIVVPRYRTNTFNNQSELVDVVLSNRFLPEVHLYKDSTINPIKPAWLPKYNLTFNHQADYKTNYDSTGQTITPNNIVSASQVLANNPAFIQTLEHLLPGYERKLSLAMFSAEENGYCNYYYATAGGLKWSDLISDYIKKGATVYSRLDGLYGMKFSLLMSNYTNRPAMDYQKLLYEKSLLWQRVYRDYPNILLETSFSYSKATTSEELLRMAQLAMRDKTKPEEQYNLSLIDIYSLQGYVGQRIKIGDSIAVKASEFYDEVDDLYQALTKYLFITDIKYNLRNDSDINITVNTIKYQDKLLQQLVKLIR